MTKNQFKIYYDTYNSMCIHIRDENKLNQQNIVLFI